MNKLNKKGFTLVELLAVIVVLALLMVVAGSSIGNALKNSKVKTLQTEAQKIVNKINEEAQVSLMLHNKITSDAFSNADYHTFDALRDKVDENADIFKAGSTFKDYVLIQVKDGDYIVWLVLKVKDNKYNFIELCAEGSEVVMGMNFSKVPMNGNLIDFSVSSTSSGVNNAFTNSGKKIYIYYGADYTCSIGRTSGYLVVSDGTYETGDAPTRLTKNNLEILEVGK